MKRLNVSIDDELHRLMKMAVVEQGTTIGQFVTDAIREKLESDKKQDKEEE